ncbi:hypothetical protein IFM89_004361 [Coptis chinensis]|uniref:C2 domain-containing protein n=1 Tax=Coptis chinensis TaxID=261450 RepID=A0A835IM40_9MAGN|nr:hypothetical protein IFM89_004361 [Coptis chinensis]
MKDLKSQWDEKLEFLVHDTEAMETKTLEINAYNDKKTSKRSTFLGKVKLSSSTFVKTGLETLVYYPLEKWSVFSQIKGEIGLKICYVDEDPPVVFEAAVTTMENSKAKEEKVEEEEKKEEEKPKDDEKPPENSKPEEEKSAAVAVVENPSIA